MHTKAGIFNLALGALLLQRQITDTATDKSNEAKVLNTHYDNAFNLALSDMDLDSTSTTVTLELVEEDPNDFWSFSYKYPSKCAFCRRIISSAVKDNRSTFLPKKIEIIEGQKVILTNEESASASIITTDVPITSLSAPAGMAIAYRLAIMSAALIVGKGADKIIQSIERKYVLSKAEAQALDQRENFNFDDPEIESEFVDERMS